MRPNPYTIFLAATLIASTIPPPLSSRDTLAFQPSGVTIWIYKLNDCIEPGVAYNPLLYGKNNHVYDPTGAPNNATAFKMSRTLQTGEQLDFSTFADQASNDGIDPPCDNWYFSRFPTDGDFTQCHNMNGPGWPPMNCFRLWHY